MSDNNGTRKPDGEDGEFAVAEFDVLELAGEFVSIPESLVVSPSPGRFRREPLVEGATIPAGALIGRVAFNGGRSVNVASRVKGVFLGWLASEGERLHPGMPLARIAFDTTPNTLPRRKPPRHTPRSNGRVKHR